MKTRQLMDSIMEVVCKGFDSLRTNVEAEFLKRDQRIADLEKRVGITRKAIKPEDAKPGDVVELGVNGRWLCRGAGRWRKVDDEPA